MREKYLPTLSAVRGIEIAAAADLDLHRCRQLSGQFAIPRSCETIEELLQTPGVDALIVCTPPVTHTDLAIATIRAGKHLWLDQPVGLSEADCRRVIAAASQASTITMVGFHMRFHRLVAHARTMILSGELGRIESVQLVWHGPRGDLGIPDWKTRRSTGGGSIVEVAAHHLDLLRFLLGCEIAEIFAFSNKGVRDDENAVISARMTNGVLVSGEFSERGAHDMKIIISGSVAMLTLDCLKFDGLQVQPIKQRPGSPETRIRSGWHFLRSLPSGLGIMKQGGDYRISFMTAWNAFFQAIRTGESAHLPGLEDGLRTTQAVNATLQSLELRRAVAIASTLEAEQILDRQEQPQVDTEVCRPVFSVVTPTFNRPEQLKRLLESLTTQQFPASDFEVIVVDDGGSVPLEPIITPLRDRLNIRLLRQANAGCAAARQRGIEAAHGQFLAFTDDDCQPCAQWLTKLYAALRRHPGSAVAGPTLNALTDDRRAETTQLIVNWFVREQTNIDGNLSYAPTCNLAFPARLFHQMGGLDCDWSIAGGEDRDLCARWLEAGHAINLEPEALVLHFHALSLRQFLRQHFHYGRGSYKFRHGLSTRPRTVQRSTRRSSYCRMMLLPWRQHRWLTALFIWFDMILAQAATAAGILAERFQPYRPRSFDPSQSGLLGTEEIV